ncbi:MAG: glycosyltransferase [Bacteroidetes bacterium]|nr:glycosyltransferase [Bacteroidota bacterium]
MKKLKVLHINASSEGGASVVAQRLNEALNESGLVFSKHLVFSGKPYSGKSTWGYSLISNTPWNCFTAFFRHALDKLDFLRFEAGKSIRFQFSHASQGIDISRHPLVQEADIIHLHWVHKGFQSFATLEKLLALPKKFVWTCHDLWPVTGGCYYNWGCTNHETGCGNCKYLKNPASDDLSSVLIQKKISLWGNNQIRWITPSRWLAEQGTNSLVMRNNKPFEVIPNPINTISYQPIAAEERETLCTKYGLPQNMPVLLFSAAYLGNQAKGFSLFVDLCSALQQQSIAFHALILGDNKGLELKFDFPFTFWGYVSDADRIKHAILMSDLYVITSVQDNLPTTIMESLSMGIPVAGFRVGGIPELVDEGLNGFLADSGDAVSLAEKVASFLKDNRNWAAYRNNARNKAVTNYDTAVIAAKFASVYQDL